MTKEYALAHSRLRRMFGPARAYPCTWCWLPAQEWALDYGDDGIRTDSKGFTYSDNAAAYEPMCVDCHRAYDAFIRANGREDHHGILMLRVGRYDAVDPALREALRPGIAAAWRACQLWLNGATEIVDRRIHVFTELPDEPEFFPEPAPVEWFDELFALNENAIVAGRDAFEAYLEWCDRTLVPTWARWTRRAFYAAMEERGAERRKRAQGIVLLGVRLRDPNWFADSFVLDGGASLLGRDAYRAYAKWCGRTGAAPWTRQKLYAELVRIGAERGKRGSAVEFSGLALRWCAECLTVAPSLGGICPQCSKAA